MFEQRQSDVTPVVGEQCTSVAFLSNGTFLLQRAFRSPTQNWIAWYRIGRSEHRELPMKTYSTQLMACHNDTTETYWAARIYDTGYRLWDFATFWNNSRTVKSSKHPFRYFIYRYIHEINKRDRRAPSTIGKFKMIWDAADCKQGKISFVRKKKLRCAFN